MLLWDRWGTTSPSIPKAKEVEKNNVFKYFRSTEFSALFVLNYLVLYQFASCKLTHLPNVKNPTPEKPTKTLNAASVLLPSIQISGERRWWNICNLWSMQTACQLSSCASAPPKYSQEILADFSEDSSSPSEVPGSLQTGHKAPFVRWLTGSVSKISILITCGLFSRARNTLQTVLSSFLHFSQK